MAVGEPPPPSPPQEEVENTIHIPTSISAIKSNSSTSNSKFPDKISSNSYDNKRVDVHISQPQHTFSQVVQGCSRLSSSMGLQTELELDSFLKPILSFQGKPTICFPLSEKKVLVDKLKFFLVGKFSHGMPPLKQIRNYFATLKLKKNVSISLFDRKHIFIECYCNSDYYYIWLHLKWVIQGFTMRVHKWSDGFNPTKECAIVPVWVRLEGLPLYLFDEMSLLNIANCIGKPIKVDPRNVNRTIVNSASVCVELDVSKPLLDSFSVTFEDDVTKVVMEGFRVKVVYNEVPPYCSFCSHIGHGFGTCKRREDKASHIGQNPVSHLCPFLIDSTVKEALGTSCYYEGAARSAQENATLATGSPGVAGNDGGAGERPAKEPTVGENAAAAGKHDPAKENTAHDPVNEGGTGEPKAKEPAAGEKPAAAGRSSATGEKPAADAGKSDAGRCYTGGSSARGHVLLKDGAEKGKKDDMVKGLKQLQGMLSKPFVKTAKVGTDPPLLAGDSEISCCRLGGEEENTGLLHTQGQIGLQEELNLHRSHYLSAACGQEQVEDEELVCTSTSEEVKSCDAKTENSLAFLHVIADLCNSDAHLPVHAGPKENTAGNLDGVVLKEAQAVSKVLGKQEVIVDDAAHKVRGKNGRKTTGLLFTGVPAGSQAPTRKNAAGELFPTALELQGMSAGQNPTTLLELTGVHHGSDESVAGNFAAGDSVAGKQDSSPKIYFQNKQDMSDAFTMLKERMRRLKGEEHDEKAGVVEYNKGIVAMGAEDGRQPRTPNHLKNLKEYFEASATKINSAMERKKNNSWGNQHSRLLA